jgi:hypothetical protein
VLLAIPLALVISAGLILGVIALVDAFTGNPDPDKARDEVQRWYDERAPGRHVVLDCKYVPEEQAGDSVFDGYDCNVAFRCRGAVRFSVPRADPTGSRDLDPSLFGEAFCVRARSP